MKNNQSTKAPAQKSRLKELLTGDPGVDGRIKDAYNLGCAEERRRMRGQAEQPETQTGWKLISTLTKRLHLTPEEVMNVLGTPREERKRYKKLVAQWHERNDPKPEAPEECQDK